LKPEVALGGSLRGGAKRGGDVATNAVGGAKRAGSPLL
jgi:hypothetical protein